MTEKEFQRIAESVGERHGSDFPACKPCEVQAAGITMK